MKKRMQVILSTMVFCLVLLLGLLHYSSKLTYIENDVINNNVETYVEIYDLDTEIVQEFYSSYDYLSKVGIKVGTFDRVNNSVWQINILNPANGKKIFEKNVTASDFHNDSFYVVDFNGKNLRFEKDTVYELRIRATNVSAYNAIAFYASNKSVLNGQFLVNGVPQEGDLCVELYGGNKDYWWTVMYLFFMTFVLFVGVIYFKRGADGIKTIRESKLLQSMLLGLFVFLLYYSFSYAGEAMDETDNMRGGLIIANGGVLYRDYIAQHTPLSYYLCAIFALLGASSVAQMRILFYVFQSIIWGGLYYRHSEYYGKRKMILLPTLVAIFIPIFFVQGYMVLSDVIQGLFMVMLALEFKRYLDDHKLEWSRSIIAAICIWGSIGVAFVSAYAIMLVGLLLILEEVRYWFEQKISIRGLIERYYELFISILIPPIIAVVYFYVNDALRATYNLAYKFNVEIYPNYMGGYGTNKFQPIINSIQYTFGIVSSDVQKIITADATTTEIIQILLFVSALWILFKMVIGKKYMAFALLFFLMCGNATRGYGFHGIASWYIVILIITLYGTELKIAWSNKMTPFAVCLSVFLLSPYVNAVGNNILSDQRPVSEMESVVVSKTEPGDMILLDSVTLESIYFFYKDLKLANRCTYFLPWYMNWYESETIADLQNNDPAVVIYDPNVVTWEVYEHYTPAFYQEVQKDYVPSAEHPYVWVKKTN